ncbi:MAG: hypothetical protein ACUVQN_00195 [Caldisericia bacterium]
MYYVIYRDRLKEGKTLDDFKKWLDEFMPIQKEWGAIDYNVYKPLYGEANIFYVRYTVESLDKWKKGLESPLGKALIDAISKIIDIAHVDVEVMEKIEI